MPKHNKYTFLGLKALRRVSLEIAEDARRNNYKIPIWKDGKIVHVIPDPPKYSLDQDAEIYVHEE